MNFLVMTWGVQSHHATRMSQRSSHLCILQNDPGHKEDSYSFVFSLKCHLSLVEELNVSTQGTSAENLSFRGVRGHHGAQRQYDSDVLCFQETVGCYRLLAEFSPQPAPLTVRLTNSPCERQSQAGISVQRREWEWKSDELHPLGTLQIWNIPD